MSYKYSIYYILFKLMLLLRDIVVLIFTLPITLGILNISYSLKVVTIIICIYTFIYLCIYLLKWKRTSINIKNDIIYIQYGLFIRKQISIFTYKIQGINETSSFIERIFQLTSITIDFGNQKFSIENIPKKDAFKIIKGINNSPFNEKTYDINTKYTYFLTKYEYILGSISPFKILLFGFFLYSVYEKVNNYIPINIKMLEDYITENIYVSITIYLILSLIYSILKSYYRFGNHVVKINNDSLLVENGTINSQEYNIKFKNINGITIHYSFIKYITKIVKMRIISLKDSEEYNTSNLDILFPYIIEERSRDFIKRFFPDFFIINELSKLPSKCFQYQ